MDTDLLAYLQSFLTPRRVLVFQEILAKRTRHFTVVTEDIYQLHNTSAVMRTCDVFGAQDLHVVEEKFGKKIDREIAMGAQKWVSLHRYNTIEDCIDVLKKTGYQIVATTPQGEATMLHDFDVQKKSAFFFGTEKSGLSNTVLSQADQFLCIPMYGFTESLNISVAAAIILQHVVTRLKQTPISWGLSQKEQLDLELEWTKNSIKSIDTIIERYYQEKLKQ